MRDSNAERPGSMHVALVELLTWLAGQDYHFVTVTPETHRRVLARRPGAMAQTLRDLFGWSLPFQHSLLPTGILTQLEDAGMVQPANEGLRSAVRVSSLHGLLFAHSAYPTDSRDAVFLGPDSYRFADFIVAEMSAKAGRILDIGAGAGVGGILAALRSGARRAVLTDINPATFAFARANATFAGVEAECLETGDARQASGVFDLILANPPFIADDLQLTYRHGGKRLGAQAALDWTAQALDKLAPGGRFLLYSGSAVVGGQDGLKRGLEETLAGRPFAFTYRELDPDIFGEQLSEPAYAEVERIAAVGARIERL